MRTLSALVSIAIAGLLSGCSVEFGGHAGAGNVAKSPPHLMWASHASGGLNLGGILLGAEVEARSESNIGARWNTGLQLGYTQPPTARKTGAVGGEIHADIGTRVYGTTLFPNGDFYWGGTGALIVWLYPEREFSNVNTDELIFSKALELVPYVRARFYYDHDLATGQNPQIHYDLGGGFALRLHYVSDFM
ncbi:MAG TPA: hypothetical protein VE093_13085 [Polyangiaceae bacterium]|jgi:hypothetical protein|nr:hypothetical protein [Polyangiaceae bacterium]